MITDMHIHPMVHKNNPGSCEARLADLLDCMSRVGIDKASVVPLMLDASGIASYVNEEGTVFLAECILKMLKGNEKRFYSMLHLNPFLDFNFITDILKKYIINGPVNGIKFLTEMNASDRRLEPLAGFMEKNSIPCLYHSWNNNFQGYSESRPSDIAILAGKFPGLRIQMAHMRGAGFRGIQDIKKHKNVWVDTSGSECEDGYLEYTFNELGADRIIHGSDYPGRDIATAMGRVQSLEMSDSDRAKIFGLNAERLIRGA